MNIRKYTTEAAFLLTDSAAGSLLLAAYNSGSRDLFLILECAALLIYAVANRTLSRLPLREGMEQRMWATILHVIIMLVLPIGVFVSYLSAGTKNDEMLTLTIFAVFRS